MNAFLARYASLVTSTLSGFDRIVLRGHLLPLHHTRGGMAIFLGRAKVGLLGFKDFALRTSERVKEAALAEANKRKRPVVYVESASTSKEDLARKLLEENPLDGSGLICALKALEPCMSFEYHRSPDPSARGLKLRPRKCLHVYKYYLHPTFGFMNVRLQTWFPFNVQICLNGREWLARQLERRRSPFKRVDNCFTWLGNPQLAQRLMDDQLKTRWPEALDALARAINPLHDEVFAPWPMDYYWSAYQVEWATDVAFRDPETLASIYPAWARHAMDHFQSPDVMRFLDRKAHGNFTGRLVTAFKNRPEGLRVKHWVRANSIKMYCKAGSIVRVETTTAQTEEFKVLRPVDDSPAAKLAWLPLRKGVADLHRRAEISQHANGRYLDALSAVDDTTPCSILFDAVARPVMDGGRRFRALRIGDPDDLALLAAAARGEFALTGMRNRDIRRCLHPGANTLDETAARRLSARTGRQIRLLRAHGILRKVPKTHRYMLTERGRLLTAALRVTRDASIHHLLREAA
jgi:hypothetical protein